MTESKIQIIPSLLTNSPHELHELVQKSEGEVNRIHVDIIDGVYADNKTVDPSAMENINTNLLVDFHLMVDDPVNWVESCVRSGADRIIGQIEMMNSQSEFIELVTKAGLSVGLAIDLDSDVHELDASLFGSLDVILVMSVKAGFGGQDFNDEALDKIHELAKIREANDYDYSICDDGGITIDLIDDVRKEGADEAVIGRRLFEGKVAKNVEEFEESA